MVEQILTDLQKAQPDWSIALLRYFNPVGAHQSGDMGEDLGMQITVTLYLLQVAVGRRESLAIFGNDYPTPDGTGVRDYIHVMDLADGVAAMEKLANEQVSTFTTSAQASAAACLMWSMRSAKPVANRIVLPLRTALAWRISRSLLGRCQQSR